MFFQDENFKTCIAFIFRHKKNIFGTLEIGKKILEIADLEFEDHGFLKKIMFAFEPNKLGQIYVKGDIRT